MLKRYFAGLALAVAVLPFSASLARADNGPITHDYSGTGASAYKQPQSSSESSSASGQASSGGAYKVDCSGSGPCKVGPQVMQGYEVFGGHCSRCHGENGEGSTFAPSLVNAIQGGLGQGQFTAAVAGGITKLDTTTGMYRVMPSWANNPTVMNNVTQIWAYLKSRADGGLKPGAPQPIGKDNG